MAHSKNHSREFSSVTNLRKLMKLIPTKVLNNLVEKYKSDSWVRLLHTEKFLRLHIFIRLLKPYGVTLRAIVEYSKNLLAKSISKLKKPLTRSGFSDRQNKIPADLFRDLFSILIKIAGRSGKKIDNELQKVKIFDTTFIALSLKIFNWIPVCNQAKGAIKIALRIDDGQTVPEHVLIDFKNPNDNTVFENMLNLMTKGVTYLFDRGFHAINVLVKIHLSNNFFITRMHRCYKVEVIKNLIFSKRKNVNESTKVIKDQIIYIGAGRNKSIIPFRLITAKNRKTKEKLFFLTNRIDLKPIEVCELYRHRWQIELLFKWLKQYLRINKLIARSPNGVLIQIYIALIVHVLLLLYRQLNKLNSPPLQILRMIENYIIDSFGIFMFQLGAKGPPTLNYKMLRKSNLQILELTCI